MSDYDDAPWPPVRPEQYVDHESIGPWIQRWLGQPWEPAATRMFEEFRAKSPRLCVLCWMRYMEECAAAVKRLERKQSTMLRLPYLSNGFPVRHYKRRVTMADFQ